MFILSVDLNCDVLPQSLSASGVFFLGAVCSLGGERMPEPSTTDEFERLYDSVSGGVDVQKSALTVKNYEEYFDTLLERNRGALLHISGSENDYAVAKKAVAITSLKFPKREIYLLKTNLQSAGLRLILLKAIKMRADGLDASEVFVALQEKVGKVKTLLVVENTNALEKSGYQVPPQSGKMLSTRSVFDLTPDFSLSFRAKGVINTAERVYKAVTKEIDPSDTVFISASADETGARLYKKFVNDGVSVDYASLSLVCTATFGCETTVIAYEKG